jgi:hypothetical protein
MVHKIGLLLALAASLLSLVSDMEKKHIKLNSSGAVITRLR